MSVIPVLIVKKAVEDCLLNTLYSLYEGQS